MRIRKILKKNLKKIKRFKILKKYNQICILFNKSLRIDPASKNPNSFNLPY
jgi:hypothetical protein